MIDAVFWAAVQGVGTVIAAIAAVIALLIAGRQLGHLIESNRLLAQSNDTMAESNIALTRPYVVVDYEFRPEVSRQGGTSGVAVFVVIRNDGSTPAHNVRMSVDRPFAPISQPDEARWRRSVEDLNKMMNGVSSLRSLTSTRPVKYYLDDEAIFGIADEPGPSWTVTVTYDDADGRPFRETFFLDVEPWRRAVAVPDPLVQAGKYIDAVAHELRDVNRTMRNRQTTVNVEPRISTARGAGQRHRRRVLRLSGRDTRR